MRKLLLTLAVPALFVGCSNEATPDKNNPGTVLLGDLENSFVISVKNADDKPIANAQILIGTGLNAPFSGNFLTTDASGQAVVPAEWTEAAPVTVQAPGYVRATYMSQEPGSLTFQLRPLNRKNYHEIKGITTGLPIQDRDNFIDFGLIMPAMSRLDLLTLDPHSIISQHEDKISVIGQELKIPANISAPRQSERYGLFTVTLDKPAYRIYAGKSGITRVFAARGRFPFKSTVDAIRGGAEIFDVINDLQITGGGVRDVNVQGNVSLNMPTMELNFKESRNVTAPGIRGDETFFVASIASQSGYLIPTDFKKLTAGQRIGLNALSGSKQMVLGVLMNTEEMKKKSDRLSASLLPFTNGVTPKMLPLIANPTVSRDEIVMPKINAVNGINPVATYSVLSKEEEVTQGAVKVRVMNPQWEVYTTSWVSRVKLPQWPNDPGINGKKRWEINFVGSQTASQVPVGPAMIESATHVTHSSLVF